MSRTERLSKRWNRLRALDDADLDATAVLSARALLKDDPDFGVAWLTLGRALTGLARYDEAEEAITRSIILCPDDKTFIPLSQMGHLFECRGDFPRAEEWFREAIDARPDDSGGHIYLGGVVARQGRLEEAEMIYRAATQCAEGCIDEAYLNLGLVLRAQERFVESAECLVQAIALDPDYRDAKRVLRDVKRAMKRRRRD